MRIKTFYSKTMSEALREIKTHLGPEALILSTKEVPRRSGAWGSASGFEVVAAVDDGGSFDEFSRVAGKKARSFEATADFSEAQTYSPAGLMTEASRRQGKDVRSGNCLLPVQAEESCQAEIPLTERAALSLYQDLVTRGVDPGLATELLLDALDSLSAAQRRSRTALLRSITKAAMALVGDSSMRDGMPGKKVIAFIGPAGVGKTTSIAKLAAWLALQKKKKVILMTLDGYRIGAIEQLRSYAGLMGIPFRFVDQVSGLAPAIEENSQRDYILIDTAGHGPQDLDRIQKLADCLKNSEFIERHLVLSAATKSQDLRQAMDRFEICRPDHLLFTRLDETSTPGPILNELVRTQKSFSYYSDGQRVPDDLHAVARERIIDIVLNQKESKEQNL